MLLDFTVGNYKSFAEETCFSMRAAPKQKGLDYSVFTQKHNGRIVKSLCSSVIYGSNAAGKTTIVGAMDTFRAIILRGNIRNVEDSSTPNHAAAMLELIPNNALTQAQPVMFSIDFLTEEFRIQYSLLLDLGVFLDAKHERRILKERLNVNGEMVFERWEPDTTTKILHVNPGKDLISMFSKVTIEDHASAEMIAIDSLNREELFLTNGFKLIISQKLANIVTDWFTNQFIVVYRGDAVHLERRFADPRKDSIYVSETVQKAVGMFGANANPVGYQIKEKDAKAQLVSLISTGSGDSVAIPAEVYESLGTLRFINLFPFVVRAMKTGATLVVDEFDASIHPAAIMNILNMFHNDDVNILHAQLIFNTHNPIFLNANLLRRDEIKFVERDEGTHTSTLYSLSDFGTAGENGVRKHEDYLRNYLGNQYGGISQIDLSPIFEQKMTGESEG